MDDSTCIAEECPINKIASQAPFWPNDLWIHSQKSGIRSLWKPFRFASLSFSSNFFMQPFILFDSSNQLIQISQARDIHVCDQNFVNITRLRVVIQVFFVVWNEWLTTFWFVLRSSRNALKRTFLHPLSSCVLRKWFKFQTFQAIFAIQSFKHWTKWLKFRKHSWTFLFKFSSVFYVYVFFYLPQISLERSIFLSIQIWPFQFN